MKRIQGSIILSLLILLHSFSSMAQKLPSNVKLRVVIIRHGEKPSKGDNLCPRGFDRALKLVAVLDTVTGVPDYTYVPKIMNGTSTSSVRMFQTVTPFAIKHDLKINTSFKESDTVNAAKDVLTRKGMVLMVWEHTNIPGLASQLGVPGPLSWKNTDFDSIWIIDFVKGSSVPTLTIEQENIIPKGSCK